jgi:hypothetical protein
MNRFSTGLNLLQTAFLALGFITISACDKATQPVTDGIDLELQINAPVSIVEVGKSLSLSVALKNLGTKTATGVNMVYQIPQNANLISSKPSKGLCSATAATLNCAIGTLETNAISEITMSLKATIAGVMTNTASVSASEPDSIAANNTSNMNITIQAVPVPGTINLPPTGKIGWDWQIGASGDSNVTVPAGVTLLDVDGFNISAAKVASLKAQGIYTICYLDVGSWEPGRPDSDQYPAYLKIKKDPDWPAEYFLDITDVWKPNSVLASILRNRFKMCADKGFDAIEPDNLQNDENAKGLITLQQQLDFNGWVADTAHEYNLAAFQKNGPDKILSKDKTGKMMVEKFDAILNEECQQYTECAPLAEYVKRGKLALNTEYNQTLNCTTSNTYTINSIRKDLGLTGGNMSGYKRESCN